MAPTKGRIACHLIDILHDRPIRITRHNIGEQIITEEIQRLLLVLETGIFVFSRIEIDIPGIGEQFIQFCTELSTE